MKTIDYIEELRRNMNRITKEQEKVLIKHFGEEIGNEFTEQDINEQTRKILEKVKNKKVFMMSKTKIKNGHRNFN